MPARPNLPGLTSLRFVAAMAVVFFHYGITHDVLPAVLTHFGYEAVTFFFVLSGFILTYVHGEAEGRLNVDARTFMVARFARIFPAYAVGLIIAVPFFFHDRALGNIGAPTFYAGLVLVPLLLQAWLPPAALAWNVPAWSLSVELFLYASFPGLWRATRRLSAAGLVAMTLTAAIAVSIIWEYLYAGLAADENWHNFLAYWPPFHLPQFAFGMALGRLFLEDRRRSPALYSALLIVGVAGTAGIVVFEPAYQWLGAKAALALVFGCLLLGAAGAPAVFVRPLALRPLVVLGEASYAMYILHLPLLYLWGTALKRLETGGPWPAPAALCGYLLVVIAASIAVMRFVEIPARKFIIRRYRNRRAVPRSHAA